MNCECGNISENLDTGLCGSCGRKQRKAQEESLKPPKTKKPIDKVGKKNTAKCSDGTRVTQTEINSMRSLAYQQLDFINNGVQWTCQGCGGKSQGRAHIVPQARCKQLGKTELIWDTSNIFFACNLCNSIAENVSSPSIIKLKNYPRIKAFLELHDPTRFAKLPA